jgi:DNA-binding GntR family transcriptional regulator
VQPDQSNCDWQKDTPVARPASKPVPQELRIARSGLREQVAESLLAAVFENRFAPGEKLVVQRIAKMLGVSPTPVREALVELAGLGVVSLIPNRGAVVNPFGSAQLKEMAQVRRVLESEAARCAAGKIDRNTLQNLLAELQQLDRLKPSISRDTRARHADTSLHALIAQNCGNHRLTAEIQRYLLLFQALRNVSHLRDSWNNYRHSNDVPEHLQIVKALLAGKPDRAAHTMDQHIRSVERTLAGVLFTSPAR